MGYLKDIALPVTPLSEAVSDIVAQLRTVRDLDGVLLFESPGMVDVGLGDAAEMLNIDLVPQVRVWLDSEHLSVETEQFLTHKQRATVSLYVYYAGFVGDNIGHARDMLCHYLISHLWDDVFIPRSFQPGHEHGWRFEQGTIVEIDHTSVFRRINDAIVLKEPFFCSRIDLPVIAYTDFSNYRTITP